MATIRHFADSRAKGVGATVRLPSGEPCFLSIAQSSVLVKKSRFGFLGSVLYREPDPYKSARTAMALAYLYPDDKTPANITTNTVLRSFFNALLHCENAAEVCVTLNEAVRRAEQWAGCALDEIPGEKFPTWAFPGGSRRPAPTTTPSRPQPSKAAPRAPSMERLMLALERVAEEFLRTVGAIPSVKAANEHMQLPGYLEEPAMTAAFMTVALVASKKYQAFFGSQGYGEFRRAASERMAAVLTEAYAGDLGESGARRKAFSIADVELSRCQDAVTQAIHNFIDAKSYPLNPVFCIINNRLHLAYKLDAAGQFSPADIEQNYRSIFTKLSKVAGAIV